MTIKLRWLMVLMLAGVILVNGEDEKAVVEETKNVAPLPEIETDSKMPILDAMNQSGPRMFPFPFDLINTVKEKFFKLANENNLELPTQDGQQNGPDLPKKKILSILIIRHKNDEASDSSLSIGQEPPTDLANEQSQIFSRTKFFFFPSIFSENNNENGLLDVDEVNEKKSVPLLGGKDDPDNPRFFGHFSSFFEPEKNEENEPEMEHGMMRDHHHQKKKKCMMLGFMRMKASVYYRTIVHLLFVSGLILFVLLLSILCIRVYKRRGASRFYAQSMHVATIDEGKKAGGLLMFDEKQGEGLFMSAPPAYDQVVKEKPGSVRFLAIRTRGSSLINSLAEAYKNRYSSLRKESDNNKSVSSLPTYETAADSNSAKLNTEQI